MNTLPLQYLADLHTKGCDFTLTLNGINIAEHADMSAEMYSARLNVWLRQGHNELTATFQPTGRPQDVRSSRLVLTTLDARRSETVLFDSGDTGGAPIGYVIDVSQATVTALARVRPISAIAGEAGAIVAVPAALHRALAERQFERIVDLQRIQLEETALAVGLSPDATIANYRTFIEEMWNAESWTVEPFDGVASATGFPGIVQVKDRLGAPAIRVRNSEMRFAINPYLGKLDGAWRIVR